MRYLLISFLLFASPVFAADLDRVSYFKDSARNRVMIYNAGQSDTLEDIQSEAESAMHTPGQFTVVFFFPADAQTDKDFVTLQPSYMEAINIMYEPVTKGWRYRFQIDPSGAKKFVDCQTDWVEGICRDKD